MAYALGVGFATARKPGKLPWTVKRCEYDLEYGTDALEMHADAIQPGQRVLIHDDLLATGGTAAAKVQLVEEAGGVVAGLAFLIELTDLGGRDRLQGYEVFSLLQYPSDRSRLTGRRRRPRCLLHSTLHNAHYRALREQRAVELQNEQTAPVAV